MPLEGRLASCYGSFMSHSKWRSRAARPAARARADFMLLYVLHYEGDRTVFMRLRSLVLLGRKIKRDSEPLFFQQPIMPWGKILAHSYMAARPVPPPSPLPPAPAPPV